MCQGKLLHSTADAKFDGRSWFALILVDARKIPSGFGSRSTAED